MTGLTVHPQPVALETELPGRMEAYLITDVRPQVSGVLIERLFVEGSDVREEQPLLPPTIATGTGSGARRVRGTAVAGGMLTATLLAILFVPVFFVIVLRLFRVKRGTAVPATQEGAAA